jgi:hypothetical protein
MFALILSKCHSIIGRTCFAGLFLYDHTQRSDVTYSKSHTNGQRHTAFYGLTTADLEKHLYGLQQFGAPNRLVAMPSFAKGVVTCARLSY